MIEKVVKLSLFASLENDLVFHEYRFLDEEKDVEGVIDLLIIKRDKAIIVDFKTSGIDDPDYDKQLSVYAAHVKKVFHLPSEKYLLSIKEARLKGVE